MSRTTQDLRYKVSMCLPYVDLQPGEPVELGPVTFWPSSAYKDFLPSELQEGFRTYRDSLCAACESSCESMTCVSIDPEVPEERRLQCLVDAISLLYFTAYYEGLFYSHEVPPFQIFSKVIPADPEFLLSKDFCKECQISPHQRRSSAKIWKIDPHLAKAFGIALSLIYLASDNSADATRQTELSQRIVRSTRFFVHCFSTSFENILPHGPQFDDVVFEPEDILFLTISFEVLLNLNPEHLTSDFKFKTREMVHVQFSTPMEMFWQWVDGFFSLKRAMVHQGRQADTVFHANPCFDVSYTYIAIRLYIFVLYSFLERHNFFLEKGLDSTYKKPICREEVVAFFWTEEQLLECIECNLANWKDPQSYCIDHKLGVRLMKGYNVLFDRYVNPLSAKTHPAVNYHLTKTERLRPLIEKLQSYCGVVICTSEGEKTIDTATPTRFWNALKARLLMP